LLGKMFPFMVGGHEDVEVLLLQLLGDLGGNLLGRGRPQNGGKPRRRAVHELDAPFPENDVVGRSEPEVIGVGSSPRT